MGLDETFLVYKQAHSCGNCGFERVGFQAIFVIKGGLIQTFRLGAQGLLEGSRDLVTTYNWAYNPSYNPPKWPSRGYSNYK